MTHLPPEVCHICRIRPTCKRSGTPKVAPGELKVNPNMGDSTACRYLRCNTAVAKAAKQVRDAARGQSVWEKRVVDGKETPVIEVTTEKKGILLKSGYLTRKGEWVIEENGKLVTTGQTLEPRGQKLMERNIKEGLKRAGFEV